jgi:hypothetical protein
MAVSCIDDRSSFKGTHSDGRGIRGITEASHNTFPSLLSPHPAYTLNCTAKSAQSHLTKHRFHHRPHRLPRINAHVNTHSTDEMKDKDRRPSEAAVSTLSDGTHVMSPPHQKRFLEHDNESPALGDAPAVDDKPKVQLGTQSDTSPVKANWFMRVVHAAGFSHAYNFILCTSWSYTVCEEAD